MPINDFIKNMDPMYSIPTYTPISTPTSTSNNVSGLGSLLSGLSNPISSILGAGLGYLTNKANMKQEWNYTKKGLEMQQEFNAAEAQKARDWNLEMDNTKYQRQVADMQAAGVNPALAMSGGVTTQAASNAAASSSAPSAPKSDIMGAISSLIQMKQLKLQNENIKVQNDNIKADTANKQADTAEKIERTKGYEFERALKDSIIKLNDAQRDNYYSLTRKLDIECDNLDQKMKSDIALTLSQVGLNEAELESMDWKNAKPMSLSSARSIADGAGLGLKLFSAGTDGYMNNAQMKSETTMGYLVFNHKEKTYTFIPASNYLQTDTGFTVTTDRDEGKGGFTSYRGGRSSSGQGYGGGGR